MLDNFIRGGQLFLHNLAMFKQVLGKSFAAAMVIAIVITGYLSLPKFTVLDFYAGATYIKANVAGWLDDQRIIVSKKAQPRISRIDAYDKRGIYQRQVQVDNIIKNPKFRVAYQKIEDLLLEILLLALGITVGMVSVVFLMWAKFGKAAKETKHLNGGSILTGKEVARYLNKNKLASDIKIADMPIVKDTETRHILITGTSGSGKTNCMHILLPQIRRRGEPAVVIDLEGSLVKRYYRPDRDIIINPYDKRSHGWDFWKEVEEDIALQSLAKSLFSSNDRGNSEVNSLFSKWAATFFKASVDYLKNNPELCSTEELYNMLHIEEPKTLMPKLKGTPAAAVMDLNNDKNVTAHNIRANTMAYTEWLSLIRKHEEANKNITFKEWFKEIEGANKDRWIFLTATSQQTDILLPLISMLMELSVSNLMDKGEDINRRVWFIIDELAALGRMSVLEKSSTRLRKYGGCILAATQQFKQFYSKYGRDAGSIMLSQFNTNIAFRMTDIEEATALSKRAGEIEYITQQKNTSYGANEHRDGISYTEHEKRKALLKPSDLTNLKTLEAFVLLPEPEVAISKIMTSFVPEAKVTEPFFIKDMDLKKGKVRARVLEKSEPSNTDELIEDLQQLI